MTLNASGPISLGGSTVGQSINLELGQSATALASINATNFRTLAGVASGQISLSNFYGKSSTAYYYGYINGGYTDDTYVGNCVLLSDGNLLFSGNTFVNGGYISLNKLASSNFSLTYSKSPSQPFGYVSYYGWSPTQVYFARGGTTSIWLHYVPTPASTPQDTWSYYWYSNSGGYTWQSGNGPITAVDSSQNIYMGWYINVPYGCPCCGLSYWTFAISKANSSGNIVSSRYVPSGTSYGGITCMATDTAGNVIAAVYPTPGAGGPGNVRVLKFDSSLNITWQYVGDLPSGAAVSRIATDLSNNIYLTGVQGSAFFLLKLNSSGTFQWVKDISNSGTNPLNNLSITCSPDGTAIYVGECMYTNGTSPNASFYVISKFDSSGTLQWSRSWSCNSSYYFVTGYSSHAALSATNDTLYVNGILRTGTGTSGDRNTFVAKLKSDGSGTGSYSGPGGSTLTYATFSRTVTASSITPVSMGIPSLNTGAVINRADAGASTIVNTGWSLSSGAIV